MLTAPDFAALIGAPDSKKDTIQTLVHGVIRKIDSLDRGSHEVRDRLAALVGLDAKVAETETTLFSHIGDTSDALLRADFKVNGHIAKTEAMVDGVNHAITQLAKSSDDILSGIVDEMTVLDDRMDASEARHAFADDRLVALADAYADLRERVLRLEASAAEHRDDLDWVMPLVKRYDLDWRRSKAPKPEIGDLLGLD